MKRLYVISLVFLIAFVAEAQEYRDVVYLKNGSVIKGFYNSFFLNDTLRMETLDGSTLVCPVSDILRIAKERTDVYVVSKDNYDRITRKWRPRGYSGSIEMINARECDDGFSRSTAVYTTHGYRFNRHLFLGGGIGYERYIVNTGRYNIELSESSIPVFAEGRYNILHTRITPVLSVRGGYTLCGFRGGFVSPGIGADFCISPRIGGYVNLWFRWQKYNFVGQDISQQDMPDIDQYGHAGYFVISGGIHF